MSTSNTPDIEHKGPCCYVYSKGYLTPQQRIERLEGLLTSYYDVLLGLLAEMHGPEYADDRDDIISVMAAHAEYEGTK